MSITTLFAGSPITQATSPSLVYALIFVVGLLGAGSDAVLNQWAKSGHWTWLVTAYVMWLVVATLLGLIFRSGYFGFGAAVLLFLLANSVGALALDFLLFAGKLTPLGWFGIVLALLAIVCIEAGRQH